MKDEESQENSHEKGRDCRFRMAGNAAGDVISRERLAGDREQNHADGVEAARMCGIDGVPLRLEPELVCDADDLDALMNVDALVITLPARRSGG
jgi:hypothetical protein